MANKKDEKDLDIRKDNSLRKRLSSINALINQGNLSLYGTDKKDNLNSLDDKFMSILNSSINDITNRDENDITSFLNKVVSSENKSFAADQMLSNQFMDITGDDYATMQSFIYDAYRNRLLEQSDLHEISSQLIELSEAILITRDAIVSSDVVEGRMSRTLKFDNISDEDKNDYKSIVEHMETKFKLQEKIKNYIIPKTLEYGEYYAYVIPYAKLFNDLNKNRATDQYGRRIYRESTNTVYESFEDNKGKLDKKEYDKFIKETYEKYKENGVKKGNSQEFVSEEAFKKDMTNILNNISVCNDSVPLPVIEEGAESLSFYANQYFTEEAKSKSDSYKNIFNQVNSNKKKEKGIFDDPNDVGEFSNIGNCYFKLLEPTTVIPIKIMNTTIGYYYVQEEDITPLEGAISSTLYFTKFDENRRENTIIDAIASKVVRSFDKKFLEDNIKFKEAIVDCFQYYNLNEKRLKFQFIPAEYIQTFKIDEDANGNGQSMIKKSLFYAKLYLMLLLFKIMSIILYSNDTKVNYIKQSGIDKNVANKVQEIARIKQSRQINITDLFSYTTLINKVGNGNEMYVPVGRSGERPIETDILQGQDIQLNSDLLEMLKNSYILATGVPAAIVNYLNEADFAKVVEQNNTKFNGRVVNYQLDFNNSITELYQKLLRWSTKIDEGVISNFQFALQPPKATSINTKGELIGQFQTLSDFLVNSLYEDPSQSLDAEDLQMEIREFRKLLIEDQLPMLDIDKINKMKEKAHLNAKKERLKPDGKNGDNGDDDGLLDDNL